MQIEISSKGYFQTISQFKFIKDIGVGSFGKVKLAVHRGTRRNYAIKIIDLANNLSQTEIQIILRQIKIHLKLQHPHIIKLWDTLLEDNKIYMIMDYAKNGSLFRFHSGLLQSGSEPSASQIYQFFYQTLQAIKYLHTNDLMHRDIKPQNLLLDQEFNIKLCDFGWATNQITSSRTTFCGTYEYMAPEMVLEKSYDFRIDIWALGVLLFQLVHGKAPFQAESLKSMKEKINKGAYQIDSSCENNLKDLIVDILQFVPQKRLSIQQIQKHPWVKINMGMAIGDEAGTNSSSNSKTIKTGGVRKHQYQKSLGNFQSEAYKNYFNDTFQEQPKHKINIFDFELSNNLHLGNNKSDIKKHKRNVTQPDTNEFFQKHESHQIETGNTLGKKVNLNFGLPETDTNTPALFEPGYMLTNQQKHKIKCKTQADKELSKLETQIGSKKVISDSDDFLGLKKKKTNILTEANQSGIGHIRNFSNGQLKQNDPYTSDQRPKTKKKHKLQEKQNPKIKKIEDRYLQITNKLNHERTKQYQKIYMS